MGDATKISWTDATWNCIRGCSRVSEGCRHCYAERIAARFSGPGQPYEGLAERRLHVISDDDQRLVSRWTGEVRFVPEHLADPLRWRKPRRIFVNSMSDLFHEKLTNEQIAAVFGVMAAAPQHTFQVLTKRARRMREWFEWLDAQGRKRDVGSVGEREMIDRAACESLDASDERKFLHARDVADNRWPLPNVWLGVSVENQAAADERIPLLLTTPAAVRFLSCEPLLGPTMISDIVLGEPERPILKPLCGLKWEPRSDGRLVVKSPVGPKLDWVIAGCESGPGARPCDVEWLRSLRDQCAAASVPFFLKQAVEQLAHSTSAAEHPVCEMSGSRCKAGGVIELPYLDGVQHASFPEVHRG